MSTPAIGNGPFELTSARGSLISIPLGALSFSGSVLSVGSGWTPFTGYSSGDQANANALLKYLAGQQVIIPAAVASPKPALVIKSVETGSMSNFISVTVAITTPNLDPTLAQFSIAVTETNTHPGVTAATLESILGSDTVAGSKPGLVHLIHASIDASGVPDAITNSALGGGASGVKAKLDVKQAAATVFTLEAREDTADGDLTLVTISNVLTGPKTFDLTVSWTKTATGLDIGHLATSNALGYEIALAAPSSGAFSVPAAGTTTLSGGSDGASPTGAKATLFANQ